MRLLILLFVLPVFVSAQTKTTEKLMSQFGGKSAFFYKSTLKMLNQRDNKDFDELIKDVEKMRFLIINKNEKRFSQQQFNKLVNGYRSEDYEEVMSSRIKGKNFNAYVRESDGHVKGTVILVNDSSMLYVLDILGRVAIEKANSFFQTIDGSSEVAGMISDLLSSGNKKNKTQHGVKID